MTAQKESSAFLRALLVYLSKEERGHWYDSLAHAEREHQCLRRAVFLMGVLLMVALAGMGYCAVLLPDVFRDPTHLIIRGLSVLGLGALIAQVVFLGYLIWHRTVMNHLHEECRSLVRALVRSRRKALAASGLALRMPAQPPGAVGSAPIPLDTDRESPSNAPTCPKPS